MYAVQLNRKNKMTMQANSIRVSVTELRQGDWISYTNPRYNQRVVDVQYSKFDQLRVEQDFGNWGEPMVQYYDLDEHVWILPRN